MLSTSYSISQIMENQAQSHDPRRLFYSDLKDDNSLDCIVSKISIVQVSPCVWLHLAS
jgi:DNA (cytosine-5)-methyltransferase 1